MRMLVACDAFMASLTRCAPADHRRAAPAFHVRVRAL
jgi:hypothetical protein